MAGIKRDAGHDGRDCDIEWQLQWPRYGLDDNHNGGVLYKDTMVAWLPGSRIVSEHLAGSVFDLQIHHNKCVTCKPNPENS